jgi:hypothetical protein
MHIFYGKVSKISFITDIKEIPLDAYLTKKNFHDAKIIINQLNTLLNLQKFFIFLYILDMLTTCLLYNYRKNII